MTFHRIFLIDNLTPNLNSIFSDTLFSILEVIFRVLFHILFSLQKKNNSNILRVGPVDESKKLLVHGSKVGLVVEPRSNW